MTDTAKPLGTTCYQPRDQDAFARVSRDVNPIHVDPLAARRLLTGRQVVHGIHVLLDAIERWAQATGSPLTHIECVFRNPVSVGDQVEFIYHSSSHQTTVVEANVGALNCAHVTLSHAPPTDTDRPSPSETAAVVEDARNLDAAMSIPMDEKPDAHAGQHYVLPIEDGGAQEAFPHCCRLVGADAVASLMALSYFVGMVCPGLHSVFSSLTLRPTPREAQSRHLRFHVRSFDPRFRLFDVRFAGEISGRLQAFQRPPAQRQASMLELSRQVQPREFAQSCSLVIGGSRGLGELVAKILAAGNGNSVITYASGHDDARRVADEINAAGGGSCQIRKLDLSHDRLFDLALDWSDVDAVYYFATPRIFRKRPGTFDPQLFEEFCATYVTRFHELCLFLESARTDGVIKVCLPSTVAIDERPRGMTEYAMAKSAAEILAQDINRTFKHVRVETTRLPRLNTDQTAGIVSVPTDSNEATLLPLIRSMHAKPPPAGHA